MADIKVEQIREEVSHRIGTHLLWQNVFFQRCSLGQTTQLELRQFLTQHYLFYKGFSQLLALVLAKLENAEEHLSLSQSTWEGIGEERQDPNFILLKNFLQKHLAVIEPDEVELLLCTKYYFNRCYQYLLYCTPLQAIAFLTWGMEAILPRLYQVVVRGFLQIGFRKERLDYFLKQINFEDFHNQEMQRLVLQIYQKSRNQDYAHFEIKSAVEFALNFRSEYMRDILGHLISVTISHEYERDQPVSFQQRFFEQDKLFVKSTDPICRLYESDNGETRFYVSRYNLPCETMDPRILVIRPKSKNERHARAFESILYILEGFGKVFLENYELEIFPGDIVYVPRWEPHHTENQSDGDLKILVVTDANFTKRLPNAAAVHSF